MDTFFPRNAVERKPLRPSKTERICSWIASAALVLVVALQMIGAVPLHAVRGLWAGAVGGTVDSALEPLHGLVSVVIPRVASWAGLIPATIALGVYSGALTLFVASFAASFLLRMRRARSMDDARCW